MRFLLFVAFMLKFLLKYYRFGFSVLGRTGFLASSLILYAFAKKYILWMGLFNGEKSHGICLLPGRSPKPTLFVTFEEGHVATFWKGSHVAAFRIKAVLGAYLRSVGRLALAPAA